MSKTERVGERKTEGRFNELLRKLEAAHKDTQERDTIKFYFFLICSE